MLVLPVVVLVSPCVTYIRRLLEGAGSLTPIQGDGHPQPTIASALSDRNYSLYYTDPSAIHCNTKTASGDNIDGGIVLVY